MPHLYMSITPRGKVRVLDFFALQEDEPTLEGQIHAILGAAHGQVFEGVEVHQVTGPDGRFFLHYCKGAEVAAEPNNLVREMVRILTFDQDDVPVHGAALFLAVTSDGLSQFDLSLLNSALDSAYDRL
ncbi:hypothetical protein SUDANB95_07914 (plasmid) [Actinosynnema sp. ALI-1.44]